MAKGKNSDSKSNGSELNFEAQLWATADKLRGHMDASEYKHVSLGLIFLKPAPYKGRVFDPCCGSGGMFVQSEKFVEEHGVRIRDIAVYGQESNYTTWKLARMNLAIRAIDANLGPRNADSFRADLHPDLKADFILANPPFNMSDWGGENLWQDVRWKFWMAPVNNANCAWIQHFIHHLSPGGVAGFVMANGSRSTQTSDKGEK